MKVEKQISRKELELFQKNNFITFSDCNSADLIQLLHYYAFMYMRNKTFVKDNFSRLGRYGDLFTKSMLYNFRLLLEKITEKKLTPFFSYLRIYGHGEKPDKHHDRFACEYVMSLHISGKTNLPWPNYIETQTGVYQIKLLPGDALIYPGIDNDHWREPVEGEFCVQAIFCCVNENGAHAEWKYDKRQSMGGLKRIRERPLNL